MAETERVALFKEFARAELLTALREAGGDELQKEHVYLQIREAFNREHSWPEELDEIEPGQARMPRWRNRLHWVVAELVRRGLLEPSEGQDLIRPTSLGRAILRLPAPFRDTPETRTLIEAVQSAVPDEQQNGEARQALADFWKRFPSERLADLSLDEYASGSLGPGHFCWWLESGLGSAGSYSLGSPRNRLIYRDQSGEVVCIRSLRNMPAEEAMKQVASWHAEVVALGDRLEGQEDNDRAMNLLGQSRTLKLLHSYFPDRFLPINSMDHMARFLRAFGVPEEAVPDLAVGRNRLLFRLYECLGQPRGLEPYDFRRILYDRFDPRPVALDETRLRGAIRLFTWYYGGDCTSDRFMREERDYKMEIAERWQTAADVDDLAAALEDGTAVEKARDLAKALLDRPSNFLNYRYQEPLRGLTEPADARLFLEAVLDLLGSAGSDEGVPDVSRFNERMTPLYERLEPSARVAASRSIPTLMLMLSYPDRDIFVRSDVLHRARPALTGKKHAFDDEGMLTTTGYLEIRTFAEAIRDKIAALAPRDMIDVQGFLWSTLSHRALWFGGVSYRSDTGRTDDMLESFRARGVYAVGYGFDPSIQALIADQVRLKGEARKKGASRIEAAASSPKEAEALNGFIELAARPGELLMAKSTYFHEQSILRIRGVAYVQGDVGFDPELGHTVSVAWSDPVDVRLSNKLFHKLAGTLVALPLAEALDVLGSDEVSVSGHKRDERIQPKQPVILDSVPVQPDLPENLILYGPPGTGKTWRALEKIGPSFADRVELVTFHPNFAYEEFVEGLRPLTDEDTSHVRYDVVPGVFKRICQRALDHPELPFLLIIDEVNRANLAGVLGELITLVEEDKRDKGRVTLPYSKEPFTVPGNLWIVGTMNTADRSIALMDVALRRRFVFEEVGVSYTALTEDFAACDDPEIKNLDLAGILQIMNERLRILVDREHQIGHAWLFGVRSLDDLKERFSRRILPLLVEYFYDDWSRVCLVLGEDPERTAATDLIRKTVVSPNRQRELIGRTVRDGAPLILFDQGDPTEWTVDHFAKILPATADDEPEILEAAAE